MKKVLIISASPRKDGNSDLLCQAFQKGALEAGNEVEYVRLSEKNIQFFNPINNTIFHSSCDTISLEIYLNPFAKTQE